MSDTPHNRHFTYRPDIDGLRAVAILFVVIFHAYPKFLRGGFIGVDIFFVISGYLITSIILKQQSQNNFSLIDFYSRRIKRIFPSLIVVLTFALVAGWYILLENEYELLGKHIAAGSIYISNFVLQSESGYFDIDSELKPLLHLWSLAIEEQFYLVFPLLLILGGRFRVNPLVIISTCLSISLLLNVIQIDEKPTEVFFFPTSRAWELLIGSLIAYLSIHSIGKKQAEQFSNWLAWFGVLLIFTAWIFLDSKKILFPSWWALMPTIGAASLIFAGETAWFNRKILASRVAVFVGLISYPLYLWHWVLLSFIQITEIEKPKTGLKAFAVVASVVVAWLTYYFVEKNIRFQKSRFISLGLLSCLLAIGAAGYVVKKQNDFLERFSFPDLAMGEKAARRDNKCVDKYIINHHKSIADGEFCLAQDISKAPTSLLVGDSHAYHLYHSLIAHDELTGGNLLNRGLGGCFPFWNNPPNPGKNCHWVIDEFLEMAIATPSIKTVFIAGRAVSKLNDNFFVRPNTILGYLGLEKDTSITPYTMFENGMKKTLQRLTNAKKKIVFVLDVPELEFNPKACLNRPWRLIGQSSAKMPCAVPRSQVDSRRKKYLEIVNTVLSDFPNVQVLDPIPVLCDNAYCWAVKENKMLYIDSHHLSIEGAIYLAEHLQL
jgi:peptidoglycan/LPS O-acetylase OafA/YrhL